MHPQDRIDKAIHRLRRGEDVESSFRLIYDRYYYSIFRQFRSRGLSAIDAEDLTQDVFLRVYRGFREFREDKHRSFDLWLKKISNNAFKNWLRSQYAQRRSGDETSLNDLLDEPTATTPAIHDPLANPQEKTLEIERRKMLAVALEQLPPSMRRAVMLFNQGLSYQDISTLLKISPNLVRKTLYLARKRLKGIIQDLDS